MIKLKAKMSKNSMNRNKTVINSKPKCGWCSKIDKTVKTRPSRNGTCNYCEKCYNLQVLMS